MKTIITICYDIIYFFGKKTGAKEGGKKVPLLYVTKYCFWIKNYMAFFFVMGISIFARYLSKLHN